jgi:hypothetical protein
MNLKSKTLVLFSLVVLLTTVSVQADPAPTQLIVVKLGLAGNCNLLLDTTNGQQIGGIDFNCSNSLFGNRHIDRAGLLAPGGSSLADEPCSNAVKISIDPSTSNSTSLVSGKLTYQTSCRSGSTAELDFDVKWTGTSWIVEANGSQAYCFNVSAIPFFVPGITDIAPDSSPTCVN